MINIKLTKDDALNMLCDRVNYWTDDETTRVTMTSVAKT